MGLSIPLPKTGHITCYRTGQVIYYRQYLGVLLTGRRMQRIIIGRSKCRHLNDASTLFEDVMVGAKAKLIALRTLCA
jgi:hypothetical protein